MGNSGDKKHMDDRLANQPSPDMAVSFEASRVALVGFDEGEAFSIGRFVAGLGGFTHRIDPKLTEPTRQLDSFSAVLLNLTSELADTPWAAGQWIGDLRTPVLTIGTWASMNRFPTIRINADEVQLRPVWNDELLLRITRMINRKSARGGGRGVESCRNVKCRVLVADDDPSMVALAAGILRGRGIDCHEAHNGRQALELARTLLPDLLILDVHMPFMSGFDILSALRADPGTSAMRILMFTGDDSHDAVRLGTSLGANSYLCKPFRPHDFLLRVKELLPNLGPAGPNLATRKSDRTGHEYRRSESFRPN
jgi:CheY-like chemotaxis protein